MAIELTKQLARHEHLGNGRGLLERIGRIAARVQQIQIRISNALVHIVRGAHQAVAMIGARQFLAVERVRALQISDFPPGTFFGKKKRPAVPIGVGLASKSAD